MLPTDTTPSATRFAGLDGLRAIAVVLVVVYHLFPQLVPGGFVGVDVFFVISGFLITSLLLREHTRTGTIALVPFWQRRARRLLPALAVVVTVCASLAWLVGGDVLERLGLQVLGAATFSYNWFGIAAGSQYFAASTPELFRNVWSLAVEEQFYLLWPLVLPLFLLLPRAWGRITAALLLAASSALWMTVVVATDGEVTRAYFGTDTHSFGLLLGVALAFAISAVTTGSRADARPHRATRIGLSALGAAGMLGLAVAALVPWGDSVATFPGALLLASLSAVVLIAASVWPRSAASARVGSALDVAPLRWIGERSYGIYLWHWPLLVLVVYATEGSAPDAGVPTAAGVWVLVVTLVVAAVSYRFIEMPIRTLGFRAALRRLRAAFLRSSRSRMRALGATCAVILALSGATAAIAAAPNASSAETYVQAGAEALANAEADATATPTATPRASAARPEQPVPPLAPKPTESASAEPLVAGERVTAIGDSVMLASAGALLDRLPGIDVDAAVSRSTWAGPGLVEALAERDALRDYVVVALGTNGPVDRSSLDHMVEAAGPHRHVVFVNASAPRDWIAGVNRELADFAKTHPTVSIADWASAIDGKEGLLASDRIHPGKRAGRLFADTVAETIERVETERIEREQARADTRARIHAWLGGFAPEP
jgi:peptidoglycan/LPS O-acetylase OafA/YrhL